MSLGTTLIALRYRDGIVVGADTRTSVGTYVSHRYATKVNAVAPYCVLARSGSAAATQNLATACLRHIESFRYRYNSQLLVPQIAHWLQNQVSISSDGDTVSLLVAGYQYGQAFLYWISPSGALLHVDGSYTVSGSGSSIITGYMDAIERILTEPLDETTATNYVKSALQLAMNRDSSSGGMGCIVTINHMGRKVLTFVPSDDSTIIPPT